MSPTTKKVGSKTYRNTTVYETQDILTLLRGVFREETISQAGGWHVSIAYTKDPDDIKVGVHHRRVPGKPTKVPSARQPEGWTPQGRPALSKDAHERIARWGRGGVGAWIYRVRYIVEIRLPRPGSRRKLLPEHVKALAMQLASVIGLHFDAPWWQVDARWARDLEIQVMPKKPKPTPSERSAAREEHCRKMLARAEKDHARALARVQHWQKKVRYYDEKHRYDEEEQLRDRHTFLTMGDHPSSCRHACDDIPRLHIHQRGGTNGQGK